MQKVSLGWRTYKPNWGDGEITMEVKPLTVAGLLDIAPLFKFKDDAVVLTSLLTIQAAAAAIFPDCVRNLQGLQDDDDKLITIQQVAEETVLTDLAVDIVSHLVSISRLSEEQGKN
jgi:hypothetical protein